MRGRVEVGKKDLDIQTRNGNRTARAHMFPKQPTAVVLFGVVLHMLPVLMHDQVFAQSFDGPVKLKFFPAIVALGGGR